MAKKFLKFWGTRGSCPVSGPQYSRYGGNTCCLEICYEETHLIIDAGTGIRPLGETLRRKTIDLFFGHTHLDHIIGLPFFAPLYQKETKIVIWSPEKSFQEVFNSLFASELFPVHFEEVLAHIDFRTTHPKKPISLGKLSIDFHPVSHPGGAFCFKIKTPHQTIAYATDNEISAKTLAPHHSFIDFLSECDLLIHEAQYFPEEYLQKVGWGHSSIANVIGLIEKVNIPDWLITHHDPRHTDQDLDRLAKKAEEILKEQHLNCRSKWIADGEEVPLK